MGGHDNMHVVNAVSFSNAICVQITTTVCACCTALQPHVR